MNVAAAIERRTIPTRKNASARSPEGTRDHKGGYTRTE
jgi:hypothetical protein